MTCHNCKHNREIARLSDGDEAERSRLRDICSKCRLGEGLTGYGRVSLDAIHDGTADRFLKIAPNCSTSYTFDPGQIDEPATEEGPETIRGLTDENTKKLRSFLYCVMGLDPLSFVAALHFARGGGRRRLAATIRKFAADVRSYRGNGPSKAVMSSKWQRIQAAIPELAVFGTLSQRRGTIRSE